MYNFKHRDLIFLKQRKAHRYIRFERRTPSIKFSKVEEYIKISLDHGSRTQLPPRPPRAFPSGLNLSR